MVCTEVGHEIIGTSMSEPHTSVIALSMCACVYLSMLVWTDHLPQMSAFNLTMSTPTCTLAKL